MREPYRVQRWRERSASVRAERTGIIGDAVAFADRQTRYKPLNHLAGGPGRVAHALASAPPTSKIVVEHIAWTRQRRAVPHFMLTHGTRGRSRAPKSHHLVENMDREGHASDPVAVHARGQPVADSLGGPDPCLDAVASGGCRPSLSLGTPVERRGAIMSALGWRSAPMKRTGS